MGKTPDTTDMVRQPGGLCSENETRNRTVQDRLQHELGFRVDGDLDRGGNMDLFRCLLS